MNKIIQGDCIEKMKIKQWLKRRRELKELEKKIDEKIKKEGMFYMFKGKNHYGCDMPSKPKTEIYNMECRTEGCNGVALIHSRFCVMCRKKRLEEGKGVGVYGYD